GRGGPLRAGGPLRDRARPPPAERRMVKLGSKASTLAGFMSPGNLSGQRRRIVLQSLLEVVPSDQAEAIVKDGLARAGLTDVPSQHARLTAFIAGEFREAVGAVVGTEPARRDVDQLQAVVDASVTEGDEGGASAAAATTQLVLVVDPDVTTRSQVVLFLKKNGHAAVS